jgi:hypothetical protein
MTPPGVTYSGTERLLVSGGMEVVVTTSEEIPPRAITPSLLVGDIEIGEYEVVGPNRYLFVIAEPEQFLEGAEISLGWPTRPKTIRPSRFAFRAPK